MISEENVKLRVVTKRNYVILFWIYAIQKKHLNNLRGMYVEI